MNPERLWASNGFSMFRSRRHRMRLVLLYIFAWVGALLMLWRIAEALP